LSTGAGGLNVKIRKEIAENEEVTVWSERGVRLVDCVVQKRRAYEDEILIQDY
jgi:hypothetical protein